MVFMVNCFMKSRLGSFVMGNSILVLPCVWKLILRMVHWAWTESETLLMHPTCTGMKVVGELGINTACLFTSTYILPGLKSLGISLGDL